MHVTAQKLCEEKPPQTSKKSMHQAKMNDGDPFAGSFILSDRWNKVFTYANTDLEISNVNGDNSQIPLYDDFSEPESISSYEGTPER